MSICASLQPGDMFIEQKKIEDLLDRWQLATDKFVKEREDAYNDARTDKERAAYVNGALCHKQIALIQIEEEAIEKCLSMCIEEINAEQAKSDMSFEAELRELC